MGAGASQLLPDEHSNLLALTGEEPVAFDSSKWQDLFRYKVGLDSYSASATASTFKDFCERMGECCSPSPIW